MIFAVLAGRHWPSAAAIIGVMLGGAVPLHAQSNGPITIPNTQYEPVAWNEIPGWAEDDHAAALAAFLKSCRPVVRSVAPAEDSETMLDARRAACRNALRAVASPEGADARAFFEQNFRPVRISKLGENEGFLTGYYEPIVEGSRFPSDVYTVPVYRRHEDNWSGQDRPFLG